MRFSNKPWIQGFIVIPSSQLARNGSARPSHDWRLIFSITWLRCGWLERDLEKDGSKCLRKLSSKPTSYGSIAQDVAERYRVEHGSRTRAEGITWTPPFSVPRLGVFRGPPQFTFTHETFSVLTELVADAKTYRHCTSIGSRESDRLCRAALTVLIIRLVTTGANTLIFPFRNSTSGAIM
jgi:hypothetical protein